jgi:dipeptidyl aminopeptidase/acylaminoacyl peptidase
MPERNQFRIALNALLVFCAVNCVPSLPAGEKPWTLDALMQLRTVSDPQITADGTKVAYVVREVDAGRNRYKSGIWVTAASGGIARPAAGPHFSDARPRWSPDGRNLAFLSGRDGITQVYVAGDADQTPRQATHSPTNVESFEWCPDGKRIGYLAPDPIPAAELRRREAGDDPIVAGEGRPYTRLHIASLEGGESKTVEAGGRHIVSFNWSPDGSRVVFSAQATPRGRDTFHADIYIADLASGRETPLVVQPGQDLSPSYSPDGRWVSFHSQGGKLSWFGERYVGVVPAQGGAIRYVTDRIDGDVWGGGKHVWWSADGAKLIFGAGRGTNDFLYAVSIRDGTSSRFPYPVADTSGFSVSRDGTRMALIKTSPSAPPDVFVEDLNQSREIRLTDLNPEVRDYGIVTSRTVHWKSKDGLPVEGVLRLPFRYQSGSRVPLLVNLHGGPTGAEMEAFPIPRTYPVQLFLESGFALLEPNFRGSINYGPKFRHASAQQQGIGDLDDIMTGIDHLVAEGIADPDRLGVMGWSYGGFLSAWIVGHSQRFKAASIGACSTDWISWYSSSVGGKGGAPEVLWEYFGGKPWDHLDNYNRHSPRYFLKNARTPSLVLHGEEDIDSGPEVYAALVDFDVPVEYVTYPREGHGIGEPMHQRDLMTRNLNWFKKWLRVETAPKPKSP